MLSVDYAITRFRRDLTFSTLLKGLLLAGAVVSLVMGMTANAHAMDGTLLLVGVSALWVLLSYRSVKGSRLAAISPSLIASGQYAQAEAQIEQALRSFSLFRTAKVLSLHHLALLRHAQKRYQEAALLCRALLGQRLGSLEMLNKPSRLILADALLEIGDAGGAYQAIAGLYHQRLSLGEAMNLLLVQLHYESQLGYWSQIVGPRMVQKVTLAEMMPSSSAARAQALLALAAQKTGRSDWAAWLVRRVELLADVNQLCTERPMLSELWRDKVTG
jgi:tetratricopeptide (TPR) repeat protein